MKCGGHISWVTLTEAEGQSVDYCILSYKPGEKMREAIREPVKYYFGDAVRNRGVWVGGLAPFFWSS